MNRNSSPELLAKSCEEFENVLQNNGYNKKAIKQIKNSKNQIKNHDIEKRFMFKVPGARVDDGVVVPASGERQQVLSVEK